MVSATLADAAYTSDMTYQAIIEDRKPHGFTATILGWPDCAATGETKDEALSRLREAIHDRVARAEIVSLDIVLPSEGHPLSRAFGMFRDDPTFEEFLEDMAEYRREIDTEPNT